MKILTDKQATSRLMLLKSIIVLWIAMEISLVVLFFMSLFKHGVLYSIMVDFPFIFLVVALIVCVAMVGLFHAGLVKLKNNYSPITAEEYAAVENLILAHKSIYQFAASIKTLRNYVLRREKYHMYQLYNMCLNHDEKILMSIGPR